MHDASVVTREKVRQFVLTQLDARGITELDDAASLVECGVADSLGIFQLVAFLEETFQVHIGDQEIVLDNFRSVDAMVRFVTGKRGGSTVGAEQGRA